MNERATNGILTSAGLFSLAVLLSGCATSGYTGDRLRDASDIYGIGMGAGLGAGGRIGPVFAYVGGTTSGARLGNDQSNVARARKAMEGDSNAREWWSNLSATAKKEVVTAVENRERLGSEKGTDVSEVVARKFHAAGLGTRSPRLGDELRVGLDVQLGPLGGFGLGLLIPVSRRGVIHLLDVDVWAACLLGLNVGVYPGETIDLLLGTTTLDFAGDDIGRTSE